MKGPTFSIFVRNRRESRRALLLTVPLAPAPDYSAVPLAPRSTDPTSPAIFLVM